MKGLHSWDIPPEEARRLQEKLRRRLSLEPPGGKLSLIAGADISCARSLRLAVGGVLIFRFPELELVEERYHVGEVSFPYIPGLLTFREGPVLLGAFEKLRLKPDAIIFDGQGIAHPRRLGLASHMGLLLGVASIGCAKTHLFGEWHEPGPERGAWSPLRGRGGEVIGAALRTRSRVKPIFVSPGHRADLPFALDLALKCTGRFRLPEPVRQAHMRTGERLRALGAS